MEHLFQILIILFLVFPFIKRIIDGIKEQGNPPANRPPRQNEGPREQNPWDAPDDYTWGQPQNKPQAGGSWDDALSELEELFTGKPAPKKPEPAPPRPAQKTPVQDQSAAREEQKVSQKPQAAIGSVDASSDLMDTANPIYKSLDEAPEVTTVKTGTKDYSGYLHDHETLRNAFVIREILDTPSSLRRLRK